MEGNNRKAKGTTHQETRKYGRRKDSSSFRSHPIPKLLLVFILKHQDHPAFPFQALSTPLPSGEPRPPFPIALTSVPHFLSE